MASVKSVGRPEGTPKTGGRKKGTPNSDKDKMLELILSTGCRHPIVGLAEVARDLHDSGDIIEAGKAYKELAQYVAAKRKAIEHSGEIKQDQPLVIVVDPSDHG